MSRIDAGVRELAASEPSPQAIARVVAQLERRPRGMPHRWKAATVPAAAAVVVLCVVSVWEMHRRNDEARRAFSAAVAIASWRSPTQGLLEPASALWLRTTPRLGESLYPPEIDARGKEEANP